ncbi:TonB-dependent siderophore receptor [Aquirhabdus parva]
MGVDMRLLSFTLTTLAACVAQQLYAADSVTSEQTLNTITVTATREESTTEKSKSYIVKKSSSATKLDISTKETPQTINVITRQQMEDFGLNNAKAALAATPGIIVQNQETDRTSYSSRGSEISSFQIDGLGMPYDGYNYQNGDIDTFIYDRVEVIKGANGLTASLGDPGATVNFIRKRPTKEFQASAGISYGSWDTKRIEGDISGTLNDAGTVRGRLVAAGQQGDSYLDHYSSKKNIFSGILEADLTDSTLLTVGHYEQRNQPKGNNWGALPLLNTDGQQLSYARSYNPVPEWAKWDKTTKNSFIELKQKLADDWVLNATYNYIKSDENSALVYYYGAPDQSGKGVSILPSAYTDHQTQQLADINLKGSFPLFGYSHELVVGASWSKNKEKQASADADSIPEFNWYTWNGQFAQPHFIPNNTASSTADYVQEMKTAYAATRLHLNEDLRLLLGVNYTQASNAGNNYGSKTDYDQSKTMPYVGVTYNLTPNYTAYASYSTIFRPQSGLDTHGNALAPVEGTAYEAGLKGSWLKDRLTGSIALFNTKQNNYPLRASDSASIIRRYSVGDLNTKGYEVDLAGKVTENINLIFGFTQISMKDDTSGDKARTYLPSRIFNVLATYQIPVLPALKVGAGLTWQDKTYQDIVSTAYVGGEAVPFAGTIRQSSYALVNVMASYEVNNHISIQANGNNITNKKYLNSFPDGEGFYGAPANYTVGMTFKY